MPASPPFEAGPPLAAEPFEEGLPRTRPDAPEELQPTLRVDVDGFEGPLDLLLELARRQKVDLQRISILALVEQYLHFIEEARRLRLELAADYLVMAAWLAYLKSRLLLPAPPKGERAGAEDLAGALAFRLRRLEAVRRLAQRLADGDQLGREVFARGAAEETATSAAPGAAPTLTATIHDLLDAYVRQRLQRAEARVTLPPRQVWSLIEAREALERLIGPADDWTALDGHLVAYLMAPGRRATVLASALAASLELAREGRIELRQEHAFAPLWIRPLPGRT